MNEFNDNQNYSAPQPPAFGERVQPPAPAPEPVSPLGRPMLGFMEAVKICFIEKYCCFKGRARRSEFWWYYLAQQILGTVVSSLAFALYFKTYTIEDYIYRPMSLLQSPTPYILGIFFLLILLPTFGVMVRRLHDTNRTGKWLLMYLLAFIPIVGSLAVLVFVIVCIVWLVQDSDRGENKYGPSPKYQ